MKAPADEVEALYAKHYRPVVGLLVALGAAPADAEEIAQEAFIKLLLRWRTIGSYEDLGGWLRLVAARALISHQRKQSRRREIDDTLPNLTEPHNEETDASDSRVSVRAAIETLPLSQRQVVILHYALDLSLKDIARTLRIPIGTVQSRLSRARGWLASALEPEENNHV